MGADRVHTGLARRLLGMLPEVSAATTAMVTLMGTYAPALPADHRRLSTCADILFSVRCGMCTHCVS